MTRRSMSWTLLARSLQRVAARRQRSHADCQVSAPAVGPGCDPSGMLGGADDRGIAYRGPDRRQSQIGLALGKTRRALDVATLVALAAALAGAVPLTLAMFLAPAQARPVAGAAAALSTALLTGAGLLLVARWRLTGEARVAAAAASMLTLATLDVPLAELAPLLDGPTATGSSAGLSRLIVVAVAGVLVLRMLRSEDVDTSARPVRLTVTAIGSGLVAFGLLVLIRTLWPTAVDAVPGLAATAELLAAACCLALGALITRRTPQWPGETPMCLAAGIAMVGLSGLARAAAAAARLGAVEARWQLAAGCLLAAASVVLVAGAARDLWAIFAIEGNRFLSVAVALESTELSLVEREHRQEEQVHDARSMIAALRAAAHTLVRYEHQLDDETRAQLRAAIGSELTRLEQLITPDEPPAVTDVDLQEVLRPVVTSQRETGLVVELDLEGKTARASGAHLAAVVQNLLVNARHHAPGSPVRISAVRHEGCVELRVEDHGPGIPAVLRDQVFTRGVRGATSAGSGLGLFVARRLLQQMGGQIEVGERPGGGCRFVLTLPPPSLPHEPVRQAPAQPHAPVRHEGEPRQIGEGTRRRVAEEKHRTSLIPGQNEHDVRHPTGSARRRVERGVPEDVDA